MLKSCWECILGDSRQQADEVVYGTQLNGDSQRAPPWPQPVNQNEIMFLLPRKLQINDTIHIDGILRSDPKSYTISLLTGQSEPDYSNIAFQFEASFIDDQFTAKIVQYGQLSTYSIDPRPSQLMGSTDFSIGITIRISDYVDNPIIDIYVGVSPVTQVELKHNLEDIRFLNLDGDVQRVDFYLRVMGYQKEHVV